MASLRGRLAGCVQWDGVACESRMKKPCVGDFREINNSMYCQGLTNESMSRAVAAVRLSSRPSGRTMNQIFLAHEIR